MGMIGTCLRGVWGNTLRPVILAGDIKQLPPAMMELDKEDANNNCPAEPLWKFSTGLVIACGDPNVPAATTAENVPRTEVNVCRGPVI